MSSVAPLPGDVIEDYEIVERIGGNMGFVFKARHRLLDKTVALKLLPVDFITDPARMARFQRELRVMGQLQHPNLVTAADARIVGCWHLVAMELIEGMDLQRLVQTRGPLPVAAACEAARQAALGLQYAHQHGLIHRDIKPSNLMLTRAGAIKVIDMGLAFIKEETTAQLTQTGLVLGTMSYCAPEQFRDPSHVDIRADIYSLGCTLFHLLAGKPPYWQRTTIAEVMQAHLHEAFPGLAEVRSDAPPSLEPVLARMIAKERDSRYATPDQVTEALTPFVDGANIKDLLPPPEKTADAPRRSTVREDKWPEVPPRRLEKAIDPIVIPPAVLPADRPDVVPTWGSAASSAQRRKGWKRMAAAIVGLLAIVGAAFLASSFWKRDRIVVLMDTTAEGGVYDDDNKKNGGNNAQELMNVLDDLPGLDLRPQPTSARWDRENAVLKMRPDLLVIHRSLFFHPLNAIFQFTKEKDEKEWDELYYAADDRLRVFIGFVGSHEPRTQFLIYSRGTDPNWLSQSFQDDWVRQVEVRFPKLKGRISTMVIPGKMEGTFRNPDTGLLMIREVQRILRLRDKRD